MRQILLGTVFKDMETHRRHLVVCLMVALWALLAGGCEHLGAFRAEQQTLKALRSPRPAERRQALARLPRGAVTPAVREAVEQVMRTDVDPGTRGLAAQALGRAGRAQAVEQLRLSAQQDTSWAVRRQALRALVLILGARACADIESSMAKDPDPTVRAEAISLAAQSLEPPQAARLIVEGLRDAAAVVRLSAYTWLREILGAEGISLEDYARWKEAIEQAKKFRDVRRKPAGSRPRGGQPRKP